MKKLSLYVYDVCTGGNVNWPKSIESTPELTSALADLIKSLNLRPTGNLPTVEDRSANPEKYFTFMYNVLKELGITNEQLTCC